MTADNQATQEVAQESPQYITVEQLNAAISNRLKPFDKMKDQLTAIQESIGKLSSTQSEEKPKEEKVTNKEMLELREWARKMDEENKALKAKEKDTFLRESVKEQLTAQGYAPDKQRAVLALLLHEEKAIRYNDDGQVVFVKNGFEQSLQEGLSSWSKTEGKSFLPAKLPSGSGFKSQAAPTARITSPMNQAEADQNLVDSLVALRKSTQ